ncbi:hypothetical protein ACFVWG_06810 [Kribbella sp. NPDC058245]|uniref:hypothetical protein n=1 Tax=Kribbella sp. NPDC058245 TaxID=3346399 RepID=UPI0036EE6DD2
MRRWVGIFLAVSLGVGALTGCGVPAGGVFGMLADGTAVVQMCEGQIDGATLYLPDPHVSEGEEPHDETIGKWIADPAVSGFSQFSLAKGGNGWTPNGRLKPRDPKKRYSIYGWSYDNKWSAAGIDFSLEELAKLKPGELVSLPTDIPEEDVDVPNRVWTLTDFKANACKAYGY